MRTCLEQVAWDKFQVAGQSYRAAGLPQWKFQGARSGVGVKATTLAPCYNPLICMAAMEYNYLGDRQTSPELKGKQCRAVRNAAGKCIRGRNSTMLVEFEDGERVVVLARRLRKIHKP
jgi:hypothetical protein